MKKDARRGTSYHRAPETTNCVLRVHHNGLLSTKSFTLWLGDHQLLKAEGISLLHTGTFQLQSGDSDALIARRCLSTLPRNPSAAHAHAQCKTVGELWSPGLFFDRSMIRDASENVEAVVLYDTSHSGDLMNTKVAIPRMLEQSGSALQRAIASVTDLSLDCAKLVVDHLDLLRAESIPRNIGAADCSLLLRAEWSDKVTILSNKRPAWNAQMNAFALDFGGRASLPSVHNFQLVDEQGNLVLQLGKRAESEHNLDFSFPLTPFQAFCACVSVMSRTFVWAS